LAALWIAHWALVWLHSPHLHIQQFVDVIGMTPMLTPRNGKSIESSSSGSTVQQ
jgi:hypothetical protein